MALDTFNSAPYWDDYNEDKKFYKILFRPGFAVQARELTQLQTILQKQIQRHGDNVFKDGSMVIPGHVSVDTKNTQYVKVQSSYNGQLVAAYSDSLIGAVVKGKTSGVRAQVRTVQRASETTPETLFVTYLDSGNNSETKSFADSEVLIPEDAALASKGVQLVASAAVGKASIASIERGVYYVGGNFVLVDAQTIVLDAYSNSPSYRVGLNIIEDIVEPEDDASLLDNALGTYNYAAPGAHRQFIDLVLSKRTLDSTSDADFIELVAIENGEVKTKIVETQYNVIEKTMARRTFDESGDYTVRPFTIDVREHRNNDRDAWKSNTAYIAGDVVKQDGRLYTAKNAGVSSTTAPTHTSGDATDGTVQWSFTETPYYNRGIYTAEQGGMENKLAIGLEPGKAYVRGYEIEKIATEYLAIDKARDTAYVENRKVAATMGSYTLITNINNIPRVDQFALVNLYDQMTTAAGVAAGTQIGTARVRGIEYHSGNLGTNTAVYKLFLFDIKMNAGKDFGRDVKQFFASAGTAPASFSADIAPVIYRLSGSITSTATTLSGAGSLFLSELRVGDYISVGGLVRRITAIASNTAATVSATTVVTGESYGLLTTDVYEPFRSELVFPMPNYAIQSVRDKSNGIGTSYTVTERFTGTANASGLLTIAVNGGNDSFGSDAIQSNYLVVDTVTGNLVKPISVTRNSPLNTQVTFDLGGAVANKLCTILATVNKTGAGTEKTKTLTDATVSHVTAATATVKTISLGQADGYRLVSVKMDAGTFAAPAGSFTVDITDRYSFNDGQKDSFYDLASITLIDGNPAPTGPIQIKFQYFAHSVTGDYFTVNSYTSTIPYDKIPSFGNLSLRDCVDFRPRVANSGIDFTSAGASRSLMPKRGIDVECNYSYYLGRRDKIALSLEGKFFAVTGVSAINPVEPSDPTTGMILYKLALEPYTFAASNASVLVESIDNKRYTMRDIGKLEKRIDNLEYYTSLSLLEQETKSLTILDETGLDRFKNGFIVDSFKGHGIGDSGSPDYFCSIDMTNGVLRPFFSMANVSLIEKNTTNSQRITDGYQVTGDLVTLPYTQRTLVSQPYASRTENVNPFAIFTFFGAVDLNPSSDEWFETNRLPDVVTNVEGNFNAIHAALEASGALGTVWNSWQTQWAGAVVGTGTWSETAVLQNGIGTDFDARFGGNVARTGAAATRDNVGIRTVTLESTAQQLGQSRTGLQTSVVAKVDNVVTEDRVVSSAVIPYIRSRNVLFLVRGLKPNTRFYPFFDGQAVSSFVTPATKISINAITGEFDFTTNVGGLADEPYRMENGDAVTALDRGDVVYVSKRGATTYTPTNSPATAVVGLTERSATGARSLAVLNVKGVFQAGDEITGTISNAKATVNVSPTVTVTNGPLVSNFNGDVVGVFKIPNTDSIRFRTGTREFKLTDDAANGQASTSSARKQYVASGILQSKQAQVTSTRNADIVQNVVSDTQTVTITGQRIVGDTGWYDPLAQTFLVQQTDGAFLTEIDVFFQSKDEAIPVQLQLREVVNGYPGKAILPFSHVVKLPNDVQVSEDASVPTTFKFPSPVYVNDATEYCVVLLSDSNKYNVWISQLGEKVVGTDRFISEQPYAGVLFKSQNASTWTADQLQDLKFVIRRASFVTGQYGEVQFVNESIDGALLEKNPFQTTAGSSKVRVWHRDHGLSAGSSVSFSNITSAVNGIPAAQLSATHTVADIGMDYYSVTVAANATMTGFGGGSDVHANRNIQFDSMQPIVAAQTFVDTSAQFFVKTTSAQSVDGFEAPYVLDTGYSPVAINDTNDFSSTRMVASKLNETNSMAGAKSFTMKARLFTSNESVSPIIDIHRLSLVAIKNKVNKPTSAMNVAVVDDRVVIAANTTLAFAGKRITTGNSTAQGALKTISVGRYINVSGSTTANNRDWLVTGVATDGSWVEVAGNFETATVGASITIKSKEMYVDEISPVNSSSISKYVSRKINLQNRSTYFKIRFAASVPPQADIGVYYKLNPVGGAQAWETMNYVKLEPDNAIVKTSNGAYRDVEYSLADAIPFDAIGVKLVMNSTSTAQVPKIKDLRIIACA